MRIKAWAVTALPAGAAIAAKIRGKVRSDRLVLADKVKKDQKHRVTGQLVKVYVGREAAEKRAGELRAEGLVVSLRRWRPWKA